MECCQIAKGSNVLLNRLPALRRAAAEAVAVASVPGLVVAVAHGSGPAAFLAVGADAAGQPLAAATLFPVASITKLATALALLRLVDAGALDLDDPLARYLPAAAAAQPGVTLRRLLCHTAGLPIELPTRAAPYAPGLDWPALAQACLRQPLERPPQTHVQYSNVGYGLLGLVVEARTRLPFAAALADLALVPLGVEGYLGVEPPRPLARLADVRGGHAGTPLEPFNSPFWRSLALPWAGLTTNAAGALALVRAFLGVPSGFLREETRAAAISDQSGSRAGGFLEPLIWSACPWGLGPELRGAKAPHWTPPAASPASFGHVGASGCLAWADPAADLAWVILGARTNYAGWLVQGGPLIGAALLG